MTATPTTPACGTVSVGCLALALACVGCGDHAIDPRPALHDDTYEAIGGATVVIDAARGVLANDEVDGRAFVGVTAETSAGGQIILWGDGTVVYTPARGFTGTDSFVYRVGDDHATARFTVARRAVFVDNRRRAGDGSQARPFEDLALGLAAAKTTGADLVFVYAGYGLYTPLEDTFDNTFRLDTARLSLIGEAAGLATAEGTIVAPGGIPILGVPLVVAADGATITGVDGSAGIRAGGVSGLTIRGNRFGATDLVDVVSIDAGVEIDGVTDAIVIADNTFGGSSGDAVHIIQTTDTAQYTISGNTFSAFLTAGSVVSGEFDDTSRATLAVVDNVSTGWRDQLALNLSGTANLGLTVAGNDFADASNDGIRIEASGESTVDATLVDNAVTSIAGFPVSINHTDGSVGTLVMRGNTISGGLSTTVRTSSTGLVRIGLHDNGFWKGAVPWNVAIAATEQSILCVDLTGNSLASLVLVRSEAVWFEIEQWIDLATLNNFTAITTQGDQPFEVADGACGVR